MNLEIDQVRDPILRENFQKVQDIANADVLPRGRWRFFEIVFTKQVTNYKLPHQFTFVPKDIIQTFLTGPGGLTWNYELFDRTNLDISTTDACTVRCFIGSYNQGVIL